MFLSCSSQAFTASGERGVASEVARLGPADLSKRTLTNLYNARPTWLANAHATLDGAVLDAYGWPADLPDDEILARLLALNLEREPASQKGTPR